MHHSRCIGQHTCVFGEAIEKEDDRIHFHGLCNCPSWSWRMKIGFMSCLTSLKWVRLTGGRGIVDKGADVLPDIDKKLWWILNKPSPLTFPLTNTISPSPLSPFSLSTSPSSLPGVCFWREIVSTEWVRQWQRTRSRPYKGKYHKITNSQNQIRKA